MKLNRLLLIVAALVGPPTSLSAQRVMTPPTSAPTSTAGSSAIVVVDPAAKPMTPGTSTVTGRVVDASGETPVVGATVTLTLAGAQPVTMLTGPQGGFSFANLPAGRFSLTATATGYLGGAFGRLRPFGPGQSLDLVARERRTDVTLRLWRQGGMTGQVVGDTNQPIAGAPVRALERTIVGGAKRWSFGPSGTTDERGVYHIGGLTPGDYLIALPMSALKPGIIAVQPYDTMFYVAASSASRALVVPIVSGEERLGLDFVVQPASSVRVSGTLAGTDGTPAPRVRVSLTPADATDQSSPIETVAAVTDDAGRFTFDRVTPGEYTLRALSFATAADDAPAGARLSAVDRMMPVASLPVLWAEVPVSVADRDVGDVAATLRAGPRVSGVIKFGGAGPAERDLTKLEVFLSPADGHVASLPSRGLVTADGRFVTAGLVPGRYTVRVAGQIPGWTLKSAMCDGRDVSDDPLEVDADDVGGVVLTYTDRPTQLTGHVSDARGVPDGRASVIIFPVDSEKWSGPTASARRLYRIRVTPTGEYTAKNLPVGAYFVGAVADEAAANWDDRAFLEALSRVARRVQIGEQGVTSQDLRTSQIVVK